MTTPAENPFRVHNHGIDWCPEYKLPNGETRGECVITPQERALVTANENDTNAIADQLTAILVPEATLTPERRIAHDAVAGVLASIPSVRIGTEVTDRAKVDALTATAASQGVITAEVLILIAEAAIAASSTTEAAVIAADQAQKYRDSQDAIEEVHYRFQCFTRPSSDIVNQAHHLVELSNAVSDLASWHTSYDSDTATLGWEREDEEG